MILFTVPIMVKILNKKKIEIDEIRTNGSSSKDVYTSLDKLKLDLEETKIQRDKVVEEKAIVDEELKF